MTMSIREEVKARQLELLATQLPRPLKLSFNGEGDWGLLLAAINSFADLAIKNVDQITGEALTTILKRWREQEDKTVVTFTNKGEWLIVATAVKFYLDYCYGEEDRDTLEAFATLLGRWRGELRRQQQVDPKCADGCPGIVTCGSETLQ